MVTYTYSLSPNGISSNIQHVINEIVDELSTYPTIERDIEIILDKGNYAGFKIPSGSLFPLFGTPHRLIIRSSGDHFPIIDFNYSSAEQVVGVDIGDGNPNVTIKNIRVQYFAVGIRAGLNSHFPIVRNCIVNNNRNVGIFFEQANQAQAIQNIVINGDFGIVSRLCKSSAIIHNTVFMNGAISSEPGISVSAIWAMLANDYGGGVSDTGRLHLIGNIAWNTAGRCLTLSASNVEAQGTIISNYNNWVVGDPSNFIVIDDDQFFLAPGAEPRAVFNSLLDWKQIGFDLNSISQDPKFISPVKIGSGKNGFAIDLNLLPVSPVLGIVPSFAFDVVASATWLPSYFDSSTISKDILRKNRSQAGTAAGANDKISVSGFFGQDIFSNPLDLDLVKSCGVDPFSDILFKSLDLWYPKLKRGYFYSNEREYYLYSKKECKTLGQLSVTTFYLPGTVVHNKPIIVRVAGTVITKDNYDLLKDKFILHHGNLPIYNGHEEVEIEGYIANWNGDAFNYSKTIYRLKINEGTTSYILPDNFVAIGPVVITDDLTFPTDKDAISNREFSVDFNGLDIELKFANHTNLISNGQFDYADSDSSPALWSAKNALVAGPLTAWLSVAGEFTCQIDREGYIGTILPVSNQDPYCFTFHTRSSGKGQVKYTIEYYDANYTTLGLVEEGTLELTDKWVRHLITFGTDGVDDLITTPSVPYPVSLIAKYTPPPNAAKVAIKLYYIDNIMFPSVMEVDAVQYEITKSPTLYHRKPFLSEITVEYETEVDDYFVDSNLSMSPVTNLLSDGFLFIPELPAVNYGGPNNPMSTTLHEWRWPAGRTSILPWARTKGKDKLRKRPTNLFNKVPAEKPEIISPVNRYATVQNIELVPSTPTTFLGDTNGVGFVIRVLGTDNNPYSHATVYAGLVDYNLKYPGLLHKKLYGLKQSLGAYVLSATDNAGVLPLTWIPPGTDAGTYRGIVPTPRLTSVNNDKISVIDTEYPVSLESFGNVIILDNNNEMLSVYASIPRVEYHTPALSKDTSVVRLKYPIKAGAIKVVVDGKEYTESSINILNSNQFFVDYDNSIVTTKGRATNIYVEYTPSYVYINRSDPYKIMIYHDKVFGDYTGTIVMGYDISIKLKVTVSDPGKSSVVTQDFEMIGQNYLSQRYTTYNNIAFEF